MQWKKSNKFIKHGYVIWKPYCELFQKRVEFHGNLNKYLTFFALIPSELCKPSDAVRLCAHAQLKVPTGVDLKVHGVGRRAGLTNDERQPVINFSLRYKNRIKTTFMRLTTLSPWHQRAWIIIVSLRSARHCVPVSERGSVFLVFHSHWLSTRIFRHFPLFWMFTWNTKHAESRSNQENKAKLGWALEEKENVSTSWGYTTPTILIAHPKFNTK